MTQTVRRHGLRRRCRHTNRPNESRFGRSNVARRPNACNDGRSASNGRGVDRTPKHVEDVVGRVAQQGERTASWRDDLGSSPNTAHAGFGVSKLGSYRGARARLIAASLGIRINGTTSAPVAIPFASRRGDPDQAHYIIEVVPCSETVKLSITPEWIRNSGVGPERDDVTARKRRAKAPRRNPGRLRIANNRINRGERNDSCRLPRGSAV